MNKVRLCAVQMDGPALRSGSHHIQCPLYLGPVIKSKPGDALLIVILCRKELGLGCRVKNDRLHNHRRGRRAKTLAAGIPRTRPWRMSSTRRAISADHCCAASVSLAVSKLWINACASRARRSIGIRKARSVRVVAVFIAAKITAARVPLKPVLNNPLPARRKLPAFARRIHDSGAPNAAGIVVCGEVSRETCFSPTFDLVP